VCVCVAVFGSLMSDQDISCMEVKGFGVLNKSQIAEWSVIRDC
jgi:hypothetical protein